MVKIFGDKIIWWLSLLLCVVSILLVYTGGSSYITNHTVHVLIGIGVMYIFSRFNYKYFTNLSTILLLISVLLLCFLLVFPNYDAGIISTKSGRWIDLGFMNLQPSELGKYSLILFLCRNLYVYRDVLKSSELESVKCLYLYILLPTCIVGVLILPFNFSTVVLIGSAVLLLVFISGYSLKWFLKWVVPPILTSLIVLYLLLNFLPNDMLPNRAITWKNRVCATEYKALEYIGFDCSNYDKATYHNNQQVTLARGAINRGWPVGVGAGKSQYKVILPQSKSDFIYAILLEEYGLLGGIIVLGFYLIFYQRILMLSIKSNDDFPRLLLLGLGGVVLLQALLHMAVVTNLIPVTGQTLPLISKGGSSILVTSLAFGIILNISHQINTQELK